MAAPVLPSKIVCVGRNYAAHAAEMGAPRPVEPMLFLKPPSALTGPTEPIVLPTFSQDVHHEVELVVRVGQRLKRASLAAARTAIGEAGVGLDLTARDLQAAAKAAGHPWAVAKGFDGSAPLGPFFRVADAAELRDLELELTVNGAPRQSAKTSAMLWPVEELLAFISHRFTLEPGDLVFTGTPEGVGPLRAGDRVRARCGAQSALDLQVLAPQ